MLELQAWLEYGMMKWGLSVGMSYMRITFRFGLRQRLFLDDEGVDLVIRSTPIFLSLIVKVV